MRVSLAPGVALPTSVRATLSLSQSRPITEQLSLTEAPPRHVKGVPKFWRRSGAMEGRALPGGCKAALIPGGDLLKRIDG